MTVVVTKKGLGSETGALPLYIHFHPHGKGCRELGGQRGEQREGPGPVFGLCSQKASLYHTDSLICVPALKGGIGWQPGERAGGWGG